MGNLHYYADSELERFDEATFTYVLADFMLTEDEDLDQYRLSIGAVDDAIKVILNGQSLGVVKLDLENSFVIADIPGLVEGASEGTGLGHQFLRHVARTRVLAHLVSLGEHDEGAVFGGDPEDTDTYRRYAALQEELLRYDPELASRPTVVVLTKTDLAYDEDVERARALFREKTGREVYTISAPTGEGLHELKHALYELIREAEAAEE